MHEASVAYLHRSRSPTRASQTAPVIGLALQAILLVMTGETGVLVDRLPPRRPCVEKDGDEWALAVFMAATQQAQAMDRAARRRVAQQFDTERIAEPLIAALAGVRAHTFSHVTNDECAIAR